MEKRGGPSREERQGRRGKAPDRKGKRQLDLNKKNKQKEKKAKKIKNKEKEKNNKKIRDERKKTRESFKKIPKTLCSQFEFKVVTKVEKPRPVEYRVAVEALPRTVEIPIQREEKKVEIPQAIPENKITLDTSCVYCQKPQKRMAPGSRFCAHCQRYNSGW